MNQMTARQQFTDPWFELTRQAAVADLEGNLGLITNYDEPFVHVSFLDTDNGHHEIVAYLPSQLVLLSSETSVSPEIEEKFAPLSVLDSNALRQIRNQRRKLLKHEEFSNMTKNLSLPASLLREGLEVRFSDQVHTNREVSFSDQAHTNREVSFSDHAHTNRVVCGKTAVAPLNLFAEDGGRTYLLELVEAFDLIEALGGGWIATEISCHGLEGAFATNFFTIRHRSSFVTKWESVSRANEILYNTITRKQVVNELSDYNEVSILPSRLPRDFVASVVCQDWVKLKVGEQFGFGTNTSKGYILNPIGDKTVCCDKVGNAAEDENDDNEIEDLANPGTFFYKIGVDSRLGCSVYEGNLGSTFNATEAPDCENVKKVPVELDRSVYPAYFENPFASPVVVDAKNVLSATSIEIVGSTRSGRIYTKSMVI